MPSTHAISGRDVRSGSRPLPVTLTGLLDPASASRPSTPCARQRLAMRWGGGAGRTRGVLSAAVTRCWALTRGAFAQDGDTRFRSRPYDTAPASGPMLAALASEAAGGRARCPWARCLSAGGTVCPGGNRARELTEPTPTRSSGDPPAVLHSNRSALRTDLYVTLSLSMCATSISLRASAGLLRCGRSQRRRGRERTAHLQPGVLPPRPRGLRGDRGDAFRGVAARLFFRPPLRAARPASAFSCLSVSAVRIGTMS